MIESSEFSYYPVNPTNGAVRCLRNWVCPGEFGVLVAFFVMKTFPGIPKEKM